VQVLFLARDRHAAQVALSDELIDDLPLVEPLDRIANQLDAWRAGPVTTMILEPAKLNDLNAIAGR
jgi:hypothetical protein